MSALNSNISTKCNGDAAIAVARASTMPMKMFESMNNITTTIIIDASKLTIPEQNGNITLQRKKNNGQQKNSPKKEVRKTYDTGRMGEMERGLHSKEKRKPPRSSPSKETGSMKMCVCGIKRRPNERRKEIQKQNILLVRQVYDDILMLMLVLQM